MLGYNLERLDGSYDKRGVVLLIYVNIQLNYSLLDNLNPIIRGSGYRNNLHRLQIHISRRYSKNPRPLGIRSIHNEVGLVGWVLSPQNPINWELCEFPMARGSRFHPMAVFIEITAIQICQFAWFQAYGEFEQFLIPAIPPVYVLIMG